MLAIRNKYGNWNTPCNSKVNGKDVTYWLSLGWGKGQEPTCDKIAIEVKEFFMGAYENKNGEPVPKMIVMKWGYAQKVEKAEDGNKYVANEPTLDIAPSDLPFY